jgi:hypothetical protein
LISFFDQAVDHRQPLTLRFYCLLPSGEHFLDPFLEFRVIAY